MVLNLDTLSIYMVDSNVGLVLIGAREFVALQDWERNPESIPYVSLVQLYRTLVYETKGPRLESLREHQMSRQMLLISRSSVDRNREAPCFAGCGPLVTLHIYVLLAKLVKATVCKTVIAGSIPAQDSKNYLKK